MAANKSGLFGEERREHILQILHVENRVAVPEAMIQVAEQVIGLGGHTKLGAVAFAWVEPASEIDVLVTDTLADCGPFEDLDWEVIKVGVSEKIAGATAA